MTPRWSVIVTCHNYGRYLGRAVWSALDQGPVEPEIIVVDDASTDETPEVCESLAEAYGEQVRPLRASTNIGASAARNLGAWHARGEFLCFLDADDKLGAGYLSSAQERLEVAPRLVVYPDSICFGARSVWQPALPSWPMELALQVNTVVISAAHRRSLWKGLGGFDEQAGYFGDWDYWLRALKAGAEFERLPGLHFFRRLHPEMWTGRTHESDESFWAAVAEMEARHPDLAPRDRIGSWRRKEAA